MDLSARVIEVFSSIQGEGIYVGMPHLFVRFWDCNMSCHYCDTDYRGSYQEQNLEGLLTEVKGRIESEGPYHAVSLTGGEPLLWWKFLKEFFPRLKEMDQTIYLETNGTLAQALSEVLPWTDIIAMDLKPPSATADRAVWKEHEEFLRLAYADVAAKGNNGFSMGTGSGHHREVFVKIVVTRDTLNDELERAWELVARVDKKIPVVLQPVTPFRQVKESIEPEQVEMWRRQAGRILTDVRVIPQVHRILGVP